MTGLPTLPRQHRRQLFILVGTLKMLDAQLRELPDGLHFQVCGESAALVVAWRTLAEQLHAETADAPEPAERAKTMGDAV